MAGRPGRTQIGFLKKQYPLWLGYRAIVLPEGKNPKEYNALERRAEILKIILEAGHPRAVNQTKLCERYDVNQVTMCRDIKEIREEIKGLLGADAELYTYIIFEKCTKELMAKGRYTEAWKIVEGWTKWLFESGYKQRVPDRLAVEGNFTSETLRKIWEEVRMEKPGENDKTLMAFIKKEEITENDQNLPDKENPD